MKKGDQTPIGSQGISLSGGQKNRIALARALYARKPVLLIDDMLAGLDNTTEKLVFDRVFGRAGLLRKSNATAILATHATYYARHADKVLVMSEGRLLEEGTFQELADKKLDFQVFNGSAETDHSEAGPADDPIAEVESSTKLTKQLTALAEEEEEEDTGRQSGDKRSLMFFLKAVGPLHVSLYWTFLVLATVATQIQRKSTYSSKQGISSYFHLVTMRIARMDSIANCETVLWLKWWAESDDTSDSGTERNLYLFVAVTMINIILYFIYMA
jgi:ATP-binding cassette subfamily C (CFTR/MRP) protein 1